MGEILNVKAGDNVIIHRHWRDVTATVDKVTPTGRIKIRTTYYTADGREIGVKGWDYSNLLEATPERIQAVKDKELINKAIQLARDIKTLTIGQAKEIITILEADCT